ncbi:MAG TPA: FliM/FliN family flagellar motor switch protein [Solirubrobacterales bacterium]|nr:FliM/FliN family flagellar motor switch protein [Solirubrobacterales bacterium]
MSSALKTIDFTRPTKFTPDHERRLHRSLVAFCRTASTRLSAELRLPIELEVAEVTQLTWANAHDRLAPSTLCAVVELQPTGTAVLLAADSGFVLTGIESLLSGPCEETPPERRLTEIDLALARRLFDGLLAQLNVVWRDLAGVELRLAAVDTQLETAQVAPVSEPTLSLAMRAGVQGADHTLTLLIPHRAIAPVEGRILGRHGDGGEAPTPAERQHLEEALAGVEVTLCAEIAGEEIPASGALALAPGDTLELGARASEGLGLCVEGVRVLHAKPGRSASRRAVQVTGAIEPDAAAALSQLLTPTPNPDAGAPAAPPDAELIRSLGEVPVRVWAELGRARTSLSTIVTLDAGAVIELDRRIDDPIALYVNGLRYAQGALTIGPDEEWSIRIDTITATPEKHPESDS